MSHHAQHGKNPVRQTFLSFDLAPWLNAAVPTDAGKKWTLRVQTVAAAQQPAAGGQKGAPKAAAKAQAFIRSSVR